MPSLYQPRRGGVIEVVSEQAASDIAVDFDKSDDATEDEKLEEKFLNNYIQHNSKRIQVEIFPLKSFDRVKKINCLECIVKSKDGIIARISSR